MAIRRLLMAAILTGGFWLGWCCPSLAAGNEYLFSWGTGYPPVKTANPPQALLMARRAAVLDAYRHLIKSAAGQNGDPQQPTFSQRLTGYLRAVTITDEIYLSDGAVMIAARVKPGDIKLAPGQMAAVTDAAGPQAADTGSARPVTLAQWYVIIQSMVEFEAKTQ